MHKYALLVESGFYMHADFIIVIPPKHTTLRFSIKLAAPKFVMVVPWRFRSEGCRFSEEDWERLRTTIIHSLHRNSIGLEGPLAHGTEWDDWFEDLLDARGIGEKYWGESQMRGWIFPRDRTS